MKNRRQNSHGPKKKCNIQIKTKTKTYSRHQRRKSTKMARKVYEAPPTMKRYRGRPRKMWNDEIINAVGEREGNMQDINPMIRDRKKMETTMENKTQ